MRSAADKTSPCRWTSDRPRPWPSRLVILEGHAQTHPVKEDRLARVVVVMTADETKQTAGLAWGAVCVESWNFFGSGNGCPSVTNVVVVTVLLLEVFVVKFSK